MIILPAIDIKDGNCVRLFKGDFNTVEKVASNYLETAKGFEEAGSEWIHMVDLDGAKEGRPVNTKIYTDVAEKTNLKVELGGGIRNLETIDEIKEMVKRFEDFYKTSIAYCIIDDFENGFKLSVNEKFNECIVENKISSIIKDIQVIKN